MSAEELRAAMKSAEDETDAAAATAAEQETAEELAEFTADHAPAGDHGRRRCQRQVRLILQPDSQLRHCQEGLYCLLGLSVRELLSDEVT